LGRLIGAQVQHREKEDAVNGFARGTLIAREGGAGGEWRRRNEPSAMPISSPTARSLIGPPSAAAAWTTICCRLRCLRRGRGNGTHRGTAVISQLGSHKCDQAPFPSAYRPIAKPCLQYSVQVETSPTTMSTQSRTFISQRHYEFNHFDASCFPQPVHSAHYRCLSCWGRFSRLPSNRRNSASWNLAWPS